MSSSDHLDIGFIGTGKVGLVLAKGLQNSGHRVLTAWNRSSDADARASQFVDGIRTAPSPAAVVDVAQVTIIGVTDDAIAGVVDRLARTVTHWEGKTVLHVSGRYGADVLRPLRELGAHTTAMHPAMAFTGDVTAEVERLAGARFAITGTSPAIDIARRLVDDLGGVPLEIREEHRSLYHASLAHSSNLVVTLVVQAAKMLEHIGVTDTAAVLGPVMRAAVENALTQGPAGTAGPVVRGDVGTVTEHLSALTSAVPDALATYRVVSQATADIALSVGRLDEEQHASLMGVLEIDTLNGHVEVQP